MTTYLVQYGHLGHIGRFTDPSGECFGRGDRVVVQTPRGLELGTVLCEAESRFTSELARDGDLVRRVTTSDEENDAALQVLGQEILAAAESSSLPITFVDVETPLDGNTVILHGLPWSPCEATSHFDSLASHFGVAIRFLDLSRAPIAELQSPEKGCGKAGCGSEAGGCDSCGTEDGCNSGSCSRGAVKTAAELTAYFARLRSQMELANHGRTPLS